MGTEEFQNRQVRVLEMVAKGSPIKATLDELTRFIESQDEELTCGILIVAEDGKHFRRGSGPRLPARYHDALDGVSIAPPYFGACGEAVHRDRAVRVPDVEADGRWAPEWRDLMLGCGFRSCLSTPVRGSDGKVLAALAIYYDHPRDPVSAQPQIVEIAAHLASIAIEKANETDRLARAAATLRDRENQLAAELEASRQLQAISSTLIQEDDVGELHRKIIGAAIALMSSDAASMQMLDPDRCALRLLAWKGFHPESAAFWEWVDARSDSTCGAALSSGSRIIVSDVEVCELLAGTDDLEAYRRSGIRAVQSTPLISRSGRMLGMISTHWHRPKVLSEADLRLLDVLARQAADLLERTQAEADLRRSLHEQAAFYQLTDRLYRSSAASDVYEAALDAITASLHCPRASILLFDEKGKMQFVASRGLSDEYRLTVEGHSPWLPQDKDADPIFIEDIDAWDEPEALKAVVRKENIYALGFIPLVADGAVVGKFMIYHDTPHSFTDGEIKTGLNLARQLGFSISRTRAERARQAAQSELRENEAWLKLILDSAKEYAIITIDSDGRITSWNGGAHRLLGYEEAEVVGRSGDIFFTPEDRAAHVPEREMQLARDDGRAANERWHLRKDGSRFWGSGVMLPLAHRGESGYLKIFRDRTEERLAEERQQLLINELNHRVKNTLATVQSVAMQTLKGAAAGREIRIALDSRFAALARSHDILTDARWEGAGLGDVVRRSIEPFISEGEDLARRFPIKGPNVRLASRTALSLGMALHELATNAAKFGALSTPAGRVSICWQNERVDGQDAVRFVWHERNGPTVEPPTRKGFGTQMIQKALAYEVPGKVLLDYAADGVRFEVVLPLQPEHAI